MIGWIAYVAQLGNIGALAHRTMKLVHIVYLPVDISVSSGI